jgi:hypothetical protein
MVNVHPVAMSNEGFAVSKRGHRTDKLGHACLKIELLLSFLCAGFKKMLDLATKITKIPSNTFVSTWSSAGRLL